MKWSRSPVLLKEAASAPCVLYHLSSGEQPIPVSTLYDWSEVADGVGCCVCCCLCVAQLLLGHGILSPGSDFTVEISPSLSWMRPDMAVWQVVFR